MKRLLQVTLVSIIPILAFSQTALIEIPFTFSDGVGHSQILVVGLDPNATDGYDEGYDRYAPPLPPFPDIFDVRFTLPDLITQTTYDIRQGDNTSASIGNKIHTVKYQLGSGSTGLQISWNLPMGVELNLKDPFGGVLFNVDFPTGTGNYTVTNLALTNLLMTVKYIIPPFPVELTSFNGMALNETVRLSWETATEVNNFGFEIERKSSELWQKIGFVEGNGNSNSPKEYSFVDKKLVGGSKFQYRLKQIDNDGQFEYSDIVEVEVIPTQYELSQNYPNPFNPVTKVRFAIPLAGRVSINLYNTIGEEVKEIINQDYDAGYHEVEINSVELASGIYLYRIASDNFTAVKKLIIMK